MGRCRVKQRYEDKVPDECKFEKTEDIKVNIKISIRKYIYTDREE